MSSSVAAPTATAVPTVSGKSETVLEIAGGGEVSALESDPEFLKYLKALHAKWTDCPAVTINYSNLSYTINIPKASHDIVAVPRALLDVATAIPLRLQSLFLSRASKREKVHHFAALHKAGGVIVPGSMTLLLAPPGHGKTTLLKALSGRLHGDKNFTGNLLYNGMSAAECRDKGINVSRLCAYVGQQDFTFPTLTVKETLDFAAKNAVPNIELLAPDRDSALLDYDDKRAELLINLLGMKECKDTIVGNDLLRGISGGQKKRVALAEMLLTNARVFCLDEVSTGLDAAVTKYIFGQLKEAIHITKASIVTALLQPTPETYELFDDVILMREGVVVYHGPRKEVGQWLKDCIGMPKPHGIDEAQWILDVLTDPIAAHHTMIEMHKAAALTGSTSMMSRQLLRQNSFPKDGVAVQVEEKAAAEQEQALIRSPDTAMNMRHSVIRPPHEVGLGVGVGVGVGAHGSNAERHVVFHMNGHEEADLELAQANADEKVGSAAAVAGAAMSEIELHPMPVISGSAALSLPAHVAAPLPMPTPMPLRIAGESNSVRQLSGHLHGADSVYAKDDSGVEYMKSYMKSIGSAVYVTPAIDTDTMHFNYKHSQWHVRQVLNSSRRVVDSDELDSAQWSPYTRAMFSAKYPHSMLEHSKMNLSRQFKVISRNRTMVRPRMVQAVLMGFIFGTLFFQLSAGDYSDKMGLLLYCTMFCAFANLTELPVAGEAKAVIGKQLDAGFYPPLSYTISVILMHVPVTVVETVIFSLMIYFIPGFTNEAGRFFFFFLMLLATSTAMSVMFRAISYIAKNPDVARQLDMPFIVVFIIFGGFLLPYNSVPHWIIWMYWISPFSWSVRSLALNEFKASRFDGLSTSGEREGDVYLDAFDIFTDDIWKWLGFVYLVGFFLLFAAICTALLYSVRPVTPLGTRRAATQLKKLRHPSNGHVAFADDGHLLIHGKTHEHEHGQAQAQAQAQAQPQQHQHDHNAEQHTQSQPPVPMAKGDAASASASASADKANGKSAMPFTPVTITWKDLNYTVFVGKDQHAKQLLHSVNGFALPGEMTALMGASGAGKTTLMDVIAARKTTGKIDGAILVNGVKVSNEDFQHMMGYVEQNDIHMGTATVREALQFSATLRLPSSVSAAQREAFIDEVMELVGLSAIAHRLIGDAALPGISTGQLKLVTIAVELVANPSILFLDEPTSGLDAPAALRVMKAIRNIAATGRTVVCTIHQPSAQLFYMFDRLLLLRSGGRTVYFSQIGKKGRKLVEYFQGLDSEVPPCPRHINPANWMLDVIGAAGSSAFQFDFADRWDGSALGAESRKELDLALTKSDGDSSASVATKVGALAYAGWLQRFYAVQQRIFMSHWRNAPMNATRIILMVVIGILFGAIYFDMSTNNFSGVQSKLSVLFLGLSFPAAVCATSAAPTLFRQRAVYYRETTSKMYTFDIYAHSLMFVELPWIAAALVTFLLPFYFMVGFASDAGLFFRYALTTYLMAICYSFLSQLWLALCPNQIAANVVNGLFMSLFFMFGGLFIHADSIPSGWKWFYYIDPLPKALISASTTQFYCGSDPTVCQTITIPGTTNTETVSDYIENIMSGNHSEYWTWMGWLLLEVVVIRALTLLALRFVSHIKR